MIQHLASNNSIQYMHNKMEILTQTISIRKEKRWQSIQFLIKMPMQTKPRKSFLLL